jgi:4-amino-4-deoxy-L-arabinose transferase-like glycosyltransferase
MTLNRWDLVVWLGAVLACCRFTLPLLEPEESRYAELPRQMLETGSWIVPTLDGQPYLDKPPLLYWLVATTYHCFGVSVFAARMVPTFAAAFTVWCVYRWVLREAGRQAGFLAAALLLLMPDFLYRGPQLTMNGLLAATTTASLAAGYTAIAGDQFRVRWWIASAFWCGIGLLAKGPAAAALVGIPLVIVPLLDRRLLQPSLMAVMGFAVIALAIAGPWFALVARQQSGFLDYFLWKHHVERVVQPFDHAKPWWYFLPQVLLGTLPWSPLLALTAYRWLRDRSIPRLALFGLTSGLIGVVLFSISGSKRPVYLVPVYPPLAVALAAFLRYEFSMDRRVAGIGRAGWIRVTTITTVAMGVFFALFLPKYHHRFSAWPAICEAISMSGPPSIPTREYAVPYGSPAASFALNRTIPSVPLNRLHEIIPPKPGERILLFVPPRQADSIAALLSAEHIETVRNGEMAVLIWWPDQ